MKNRRTYKVIELEKANWEGNKYTTIDDLGKKGLFTFATMEAAQKRCDEYNSTYYLSDYSDDEILDYFNSVDFKLLLDKINSLIGLELTYDINIKKDRSGTYNHFEIESKENLTDHFPLLALLFKDAKVTTFNADIYCDRTTGKLSLWCTIHFSYQTHNLGTNGVEFLSAWYDNDKWTIQVDKDMFNNKN